MARLDIINGTDVTVLATISTASAATKLNEPKTNYKLGYTETVNVKGFTNNFLTSNYTRTYGVIEESKEILI